MHKYKKNRKKKLKREKKRVFSANWARGDFGPAGPRKGGMARANAVGAGPHVRGGGGVTMSGGERRAARGGENWPLVAVLRRWPGSASTEWWQGTGGGRGLQRWGQFGQWTLRVASPRRGGGRPWRWDRQRGCRAQ
jgi:hypothetical protein